MYTLKNYCPFAGSYVCEYPVNAYRSEEDTEKEEKKQEDEKKAEIEQRQYPEAMPGMPPGGVTGHYTFNPAEILRLIEMNNPEIIRTMMAYGIPLATARRIIMRIIRLVLRYHRE